MGRITACARAYIDQRHSNRDWIAHYGKMLTSPINVYPDKDKVVYVSSFFEDTLFNNEKTIYCNLSTMFDLNNNVITSI